MKALVVQSSGNKKTGPIAVTYSDKQSCPATCPLADECYGKKGRTILHWNRVDRDGLQAEEVFKQIKQSPHYRWWRHNVVGDLWHDKGKIKEDLLNKLTTVLKPFPRKWTYTHHVLSEHNRRLIKEARDKGFVINLSTESTEVASQHYEDGFDVTCVIDKDTPRSFNKHGVQFVRCPEEYRDCQCATCGGGRPFCARAERKFIVAFGKK
jgi:hypothetical protein